MPVKTIKKQIADLVRDGDLAAYQDRQRITYAPTVQVGEAVSMAYSVGQPFVKVPRAWFHYWPDATFTELLLLGLYRFKLTDGLTGESWQHPCKLTMGEIQERIGFTVLTWKRAASALQDRGLIVRARHSKGYNVTLPV